MVQADSMSPVIVVCGPTACGKSALAIELAEALDGEIVSADSIAVYRGLDIGTAKPDKKDRERVKHLLIDVVDAREEFSVAEYEELALKEIARIRSEGKTPIICGGTGYYIDAVLFKKSYGNCPKNPEIREKLDDLRKEKGEAFLYEELKTVDPETAAKIFPNDYMRVSRALEIFYSTGVKKSDIKDELKPRFPYIALTVSREREDLYARINERVDRMFGQGLLSEVKGLLAAGVDKNAQSMQGIGYKEVVEGFENDLSEDEIKETIKQNTRRYAKRQITYFKRLQGLKALSPDNAISEALEIINGTNEDK